MHLIDHITVETRGVTRSIELLLGDLATLPADAGVDLLLVSAFPDCYSPVPSTLIGALDRTGLSVEALARDKAVDLRCFTSCWISQRLPKRFSYRRILCFEPAEPSLAPEIVGDLFRSLVPLLGADDPIRSIAMPLLAAGMQGGSGEMMLRALLEAALHWLQHGLELDVIRIVLRDCPDLPTLQQTFVEIKQEFIRTQPTPTRHAHDLFISYAHRDTQRVDRLIEGFRLHSSSLRLFVDRFDLRPGASWQAHIFEALEHSRQVLCLLSPHYLASKVCMEEYNIGLLKQRQSDAVVLLPVMIQRTPLPYYMQLRQFLDAADADDQDLLHWPPRILASAA